MTEVPLEQHSTGRGRLEVFAGILDESFVPLSITLDDVGSFVGLARAASLGALHVSDVAVGGSVTMQRTPQLIGRKAPEYVKVNLLLRGRCLVSQDGREAVLDPGDFVLYDTTRPFRFASQGPFHMYGVTVPSRLFPLPESRMVHLTARRFSSQQGSGAFMARFIRQLGGQFAAGRHTESVHLADAMLDLLTAAFAEQSAAHDCGIVDTGRSGLLVRIRGFIESRLADPRLDVSAIAAAHHISVRHLQKLFEADGQTPTGWVRSRRIEQCCRDLSSIELVNVAVGDVGLRWGFVDAAYFSRAFKASCGLSPRQYRDRVLKAQSRNSSRQNRTLVEGRSETAVALDGSRPESSFGPDHALNGRGHRLGAQIGWTANGSDGRESAIA
ncbi:helix-turn-helix domain-containing protein [Mycobacterium sp. AT1]|uniref:AraC-like ligand-binding domain-containing protein n=1 Tax=Mycobacterium sp. AT1 TaxID=1961706 RepID=UPI0009ACD6A9|nr:helix-turn-helix domain-containing protein [Mycobacterium sp. AT1]OPX10908.1 hypothetical protein B1790_09680 [Mycobacterium sp. AT1]